MPSELARLELGVDVLGVGCWAPHLADVAALVEDRPRDTAGEPDASLIPARQRRRTTLLARMAADAMRQACAQAGFDVARVETVYASMLGEVDAAATLIEMMTRSGIMSPTRFQNSVHNAASGLVSIATGNPSLTTSVSAGWDLVAMALLEGMALCNARHTDVVVVIEEESWPAFVPHTPFAPACVALAMQAPRAPAPDTLATLSGLHQVSRSAAPRPAAPLDPHLADSPVAPAFDLLRAVCAGAPGRVALEPLTHGAVDAPVWVVEVAPGGSL